MSRIPIRRVTPTHDGTFVKHPEEIHFHLRKLGTAVAQWLRCCATNRKVAGSISAGVTGILH